MLSAHTNNISSRQCSIRCNPCLQWIHLACSTLSHTRQYTSEFACSNCVVTTRPHMLTYTLSVTHFHNPLPYATHMHHPQSALPDNAPNQSINQSRLPRPKASLCDIFISHAMSYGKINVDFCGAMMIHNHIICGCYFHFNCSSQIHRGVGPREQ